MLKNIATLQHVIGQNTYRLECDANSPVVEVKEALCAFMKYVGNIEDAAKKAAAEKEGAQKEDPPKVE